MDLIKREDAIKAIDDMQNGYDGWTDRFDKAQIIGTLEDPTIVPSADRPQGEWIPCSERLPEPNQYVLVTYKTTDEVHICQYYGDGSENPWYSLIDECLAWNNVVLAWMPLPQPWKGADDE